MLLLVKKISPSIRLFKLGFIPNETVKSLRSTMIRKRGDRGREEKSINEN